MSNALLSVLNGLRRFSSDGHQKQQREQQKGGGGVSDEKEEREGEVAEVTEQKTENGCQNENITATRRRSLRSGDSPELIENSTDQNSNSSNLNSTAPINSSGVWFSFDLSKGNYDYSEQIPIIGEKLEKKKPPPIQTKGDVATNKLQLKSWKPLDTPPEKDPLSDEVYGPCFRRKEREEKRIQTIERDRNFMEMDRLETFQEELKGPNWRRELQRITQIDDLLDEREVLEKRQLTLNEIHNYIERYKEWKFKESQLKSSKLNDSHLYYDDGHDEKNNIEEATTTPVKKKRTTTTRKKPQPPKPATTTTPKKFTSFYDNLALRPRFDQLTRRSHQLRGPHLAFGQPIPEPDFINPEFDIPEDWKNTKFK